MRVFVGQIPIVRCRLDGTAEDATAVRYVPLSEFELWRHFMETRHGRWVLVEDVSLWIPEESARRTHAFPPEDLEPVLRIHLDVDTPHGVPVPVERFFPAETYPLAQERLLSHYNGAARVQTIVATPGYFVPAQIRESSSSSA